jgi:hypothetical protein
MLLIVLWALVSACDGPPNFVACANLGDEGHCVEYVTKKKFNVDNSGKHQYTTLKGKKLNWNQVVAGSALLPADQLAALKTHFDDYCHDKTCPNGIGDWNTFANELTNKGGK